MLILVINIAIIWQQVYLCAYISVHLHSYKHSYITWLSHFNHPLSPLLWGSLQTPRLPSISLVLTTSQHAVHSFQFKFRFSIPHNVFCASLYGCSRAEMSAISLKSSRAISVDRGHFSLWSRSSLSCPEIFLPPSISFSHSCLLPLLP